METVPVEEFDDWYGGMAGVTATDRIHQRFLGLPAHVVSNSLLTGDGIDAVVGALALEPGDLLLDLACGRGAYGLEVAARTGARHLGIDFSAEAIRRAAAYAQELGREADFRLGDLTATGLPDASVDGIMVIDAIQFPAEPAAAYAEIRRVLRPGGRVALTGWKAVDRDDERVSERIRRTDLRAGLEGAGFRDVVVEERADWRAAERALWEEAAALDPGDDPTLRSLHEEGVRVLPGFDRVRRVFAHATA